jgi:hypothetical protein
MADWEDVRRIVASLPETAEEPTGWRVKGKPLAWERPLRESDVAALTSLGAPIPDGPILAARVPGLGAREALLADDPDVYFITPHFANYPAVLVRLPLISAADLEELLTEAWLTQAPKRLAAAFLASRP